MGKTVGQIESRKHEDRLAKRTGGTRNAGSGSFWSRKNDVRSEDLLIEHKWTGKKTFTLKSEVIRQLIEEAIISHRMPVFGIHLDGHNYVLIEEDDFFLLKEGNGIVP